MDLRDPSSCLRRGRIDGPDDLQVETEAFLHQRLNQRDLAIEQLRRERRPGLCLLRLLKLSAVCVVATVLLAEATRSTARWIGHFSEDLRSDVSNKFPCRTLKDMKERGMMVLTEPVAVAESDGNPCGFRPFRDRYEVWQIVFNGSVNVRGVNDLSSEIVGLKWKCDKFAGQKEGNWVKLLREPGYVISELGGVPLLKKLYYYQWVATESCEAAGMQPISDESTCAGAAEVLGLPNTTVQQSHNYPGGCYADGGNTLWMSSAVNSLRQGAPPESHPICWSAAAEDQCEPAVTTTVTTTTTTSKTSSVPSPTFFCFTVARASEGSKEPELLRHQLKHGMGIFSCEEFTAFSHLGAVTLGHKPQQDWTLGQIYRPPAEKGISSAGAGETWFNIDIFTEVWRYVMYDGRFQRHNWTVKADPDTVFFADRLRTHLRPHTSQWSNAFIMNCNNGFKPRLIGSLEVLSRLAVETFTKNPLKCKGMRENLWGEDTFLQTCMMMLGSTQIYDFNMLADVRCSSSTVGCSDTSKAAYHSFGDVQRYDACFKEAQR